MIQINPTPSSPMDQTQNASPNQLNNGDFMTLLIAQLQSQDPFSPMDPMQFVTQLVQFNQLDELQQISQEISNLAPSGSTSH